MKNAIVLCSGGIDSVTTANYVKRRLDYQKIIILFFNYEQKTLKQERIASKKCAKKLNAEFREINLKWLGKISESLINKKGVSKISRKDLKNTLKESEKFYVPCRNTLFLIYALALAESEFVKNKSQIDIFVGFKNEGEEPFPDATERFTKKINELSRISCTGKFKIIAPLIKRDKEDIIKMGIKLGINYKDTFSCYTNKTPKHCGACLACKLRQAGFYWANIPDPTNYELKEKY